MTLVYLPTQTAIGFWIAFLTGLVLIVGTYIRTGKLASLWALLPLVFILSDIVYPTHTSLSPQVTTNDPIAAAIVSAVGFAVLFFIMWRSRKVEVLWAMLAVNLIMNLFV